VLLAAVHGFLTVLVRPAVVGGTASGGIAGRKRARLLPERPFEKITPEAGE